MQSVEIRLQEHNAGKSKSTRAGAPWTLTHTEYFATRPEALLQERKIKARGIGRYLSGLESKLSGERVALKAPKSDAFARILSPQQKRDF